MRDVFSENLAERLADAERVAVLTGAGISAESGIPTFRDPDGLWQRLKPEELANVDAFLRNPVLVQEWYAHRRRLASETEPNAGHRALAELEAMTPHFTLVTQNVDNLHHRAGSRNVVELHGNITRSYCIDCGEPAALQAEKNGEPASCMTCGGLLRPDVVWFGEMLPMDALATACAAAQAADVFLSIGTSAIVYPAAEIPLLAREYGSYTVEINVQPSQIAGQMDEILLGKSGEILPALIGKMRTLKL